MRSCSYNGFNDIVTQTAYILASIHMTVTRVEIPHQDHTGVLHEVEHMRRESRRNDAVHKFQSSGPHSPDLNPIPALINAF